MAKKDKRKTGDREHAKPAFPIFRKSCENEKQRARKAALKAHGETDLSSGPVTVTIEFQSVYGGDRQENVVLHPAHIQHENGLRMARIR